MYLQNDLLLVCPLPLVDIYKNECTAMLGQDTPSSGTCESSPGPHNLVPLILAKCFIYRFVHIFCSFMPQYLFLSYLFHSNVLLSFFAPEFSQNPRLEMCHGSHLIYLHSVHKFHETLPVFSLWSMCMSFPLEVFKPCKVSELLFWNR